MNSSSQATAIQTALDLSEVTPTPHYYYADRVEEEYGDNFDVDYGESWTAEAAEEEAYYCRPMEVKCKCGVWGGGSQWLLESVGWHLGRNEVCPQCTQRSIDLGGRPEWVL